MNAIRRPTATTVLVAILAMYACVRGVEVVTGSPRTSIVALEVFSAMAFAVLDGARHYGGRGILVFAAICAVIGNVVENIGVATGFPFGRYEFLELMGPKFLHVPMLLGPAYIGMAYVSWMLARLILGNARVPAAALPVAASAIMVSWDWAQDPVWATLLHGWRWYDGGPWFGVPLSNYFGWFLTVFLIYIAFSVYLRRWPPPAVETGAAQWPPVVFYALCAAGNAMQVFTRLPQQTAADATGRTWPVADILSASALVSIFAMGGFVIAGVWRLSRQSSNQIPG